MSERSVTSIHFFSGSGLGLLVGIILGLSVSEVAGIVLGALTALLAAFLGLKKDFAPEKGPGNGSGSPSSLKWLRSGAFGLFCVLGILLGIMIRSHGLLSVPIDRQLEKWTRAGYDRAQARQFVVYQQLGLKPEEWEVVDSSGLARKRQAGVLFSEEDGADLCRAFATERYDDPQEVLYAYKLAGGGWKALASAIENNVPSDRRMRLLRSLWEAICER